MKTNKNSVMPPTLIYSYTREQALADGVLCDVSEMAREVGNITSDGTDYCRLGAVRTCPQDMRRARRNGSPVGHPVDATVRNGCESHWLPVGVYGLRSEYAAKTAVREIESSMRARRRWERGNHDHAPRRGLTAGHSPF